MNKAYVLRDQLKRATHTRAGKAISAATRTELDGALDALDDAQMAIDRALERINSLIDLPAADGDADTDERAARQRGFYLVDAEVEYGGAAQRPTGYYVNGEPVTVRERQPLGDVQVVRRADKPMPGSPGYTLYDAE